LRHRYMLPAIVLASACALAGAPAPSARPRRPRHGPALTRALRYGCPAGPRSGCPAARARCCPAAARCRTRWCRSLSATAVTRSQWTRCLISATAWTWACSAQPTGSAAAFVPVEFPDLVRHGEGRFEAAECELAGPCDQLLAVCPVLVSATANAGGLAEDLQYTPGGPASGVAGPSGAPAMGMLRIMSAAEPRSSCWRQQPASPVSSCRFAAPGQPSMRPATRRFPGSSTAGAKPRSWPATRSWTSTRPRRCGRSHALARAVLVPVYEA
jgi:hypothetical protein